MVPRIPRAIVASVMPAALSPTAVRRSFDNLRAEGVRLKVAGTARDAPDTLLARGYGPRYLLELFGTRYFLSDVRQNPDLRFFVAVVSVRWPFGECRFPGFQTRIPLADVELKVAVGRKQMAAVETGFKIFPHRLDSFRKVEVLNHIARVVSKLKQKPHALFCIDQTDQYLLQMFFCAFIIA